MATKPSNKPRHMATKKMLIIPASGRKGGNSDLLCDWFAKGAREAGREVDSKNHARRMGERSMLTMEFKDKAAR